MKYLLDTCIISDFVKGSPTVLEKIKYTPHTELAISTLTVMEIEYGLQLLNQKHKSLEKVLNDFLNLLTILPYTTKTAQITAFYRAYLKQKGTPIGAYDILIAATALEHNLTMVTSNTKEFKRVPELKCIDWKNKPQH